MTVNRLVLPRLSRVEAAAARVRSACRGSLTFEGLPFANGPLRLSIDNVGLTEFGPEESCLTLTWGRDRLQLRCPMGLLRQILGALDPALEVEGMPPDLATLLLEAAMLPIITRCERLTGRDVSIRESNQADFHAADEGLRLFLEYDDRRWPLLLTTVESRKDAPDALAALLRFWPVAPRSMARFSLPAAFRIGKTTLPVAALASLQPGDAVLLQIGDGKKGLLVIAEMWTAGAQRRAAEWQLFEAPRAASEAERMEWTLRSVDTVEGEQTGVSVNNPDQLPVQLTFEVGRSEITLAELRTLGAGSVLELGRSVAEPIRISAQGRPVGQGELVDVEGVVGVKITRLFDYE
jgi:type III secretion protein Q